MKIHNVARVLFVCIVLFCATSVSAQKLTVYSVMGTVTEMKAGSKNKVLPKAQLSATSNIAVGASSRIVLLDEANKEMYTIKGAVEGKIDLLLKGNNVVKKKLTSQYFTVLMNKLSNSASRSTYMQSAATSYRDTEELMKKLDSLKNEKDSIRQTTAVEK